MRRVPAWTIVAGVAVIVFACFSPALTHDWVDIWDDGQNIIDNTAYRGLGFDNLRWAFTTFHEGSYQPLCWLSFGLDYELWGMDPRGYHLTNNVLHALNALLVYFMTLIVLRRVLGLHGHNPDSSRLRWAAAFGALIFAIHPLRVESVAWVTERKDVLSGAFYLLAAISYLRWRELALDRGARIAFYAVTVACFFLATLAKATGVMLPLAFLLIDAYPLRRIRFQGFRLRLDRSVVLDKLPLLFIAVWVSHQAIRGQQHADALASLENYGLVARLLQATYGLWFYTWKTLAPTNLSPMYEVSAHPADPSFWLAAIAVLALTAILILHRQRWPGLLTAWL